MTIHFIGVCGTAMATLAALLKRQGHDVQGSDENVYPPMSTFLESERIRTLTGYSADHITASIDMVVVGNAISRGNAELEAVLDRKMRYCSLPEAVREHFLWKARSIVIAGTHGKTTTTSLTGWLLVHGGADPSVLVGGIARNLGEDGSSYRLGKGRDFVIEGDEYDSAFFDKTAKFLKYLPDIAVINNVEFDHADIYADLDAVRLAFRRLVESRPSIGTAVAWSRFSGCRGVEKSGCQPGGDLWPERGRRLARDRRDGIGGGAGVQRMARRNAVREHAKSRCSVLHNVRNALAAIAVAHTVSIPAATMAEGLRQFKGVKRRLEIYGEAAGVTVYDDFAHHPTAIAETLAGLRAANPHRRIWAIFEPRSASSSRRVFQQDFARAFGAAPTK